MHIQGIDSCVTLLLVLVNEMLQYHLVVTLGIALLLTFRRVNSEATTFFLFILFERMSLLSREWISSLSPCVLAVQGLDSVPLQFAQPLDHLSAGGAQSHKPLSRARSEPLPQSPHALHTHLLQQQHNTQLLERLKQQTHLGKVGIHVHLSVLFEIIHDLLFATFASRLIKPAACNLLNMIKGTPRCVIKGGVGEAEPFLRLFY